MLKILLADDHEVVRRGLRDLFHGHHGWTVCAETSNGRDAVKMAIQLKPHIAVLDLLMPELNGIEATRQIRRECPSAEVLIFADGRAPEQLISRALVAGARGFVLKSDSGEVLITAVESLSHHRPFFGSQISEVLLDTFLNRTTLTQAGSDLSVLTNREREIVQMLAEARTNKEVAQTLQISIKTVETHRSSVMRKLGITSVVQLVHYAIRNQLVEV